MKRRRVAAARSTAAALAVAVAATAPLHGRQERAAAGAPAAPCAAAREAAAHGLHELSPIGTRPVRLRIDHAFVLFRLGRTTEAQASLGSAVSLLDLTRGGLMTSGERARVESAVGALRRCIANTAAPPLANLTVRTYDEDERSADGRGPPAASGAVVRIDGTLVGRTGRGGIFTGRVPSGSIRVSAEVQPGEAGSAAVTLAPGGTGSVSIRLESGKDVLEETPVIIAEATGGVLSAASPTLTLKFVAPDGPVRIDRMDEVDLRGPEGNIEEALTPMFRVRDGAILAIDAAKVIAIMRARRGWPLVLSVQANDRRGVGHASRVEFRVE